MPTGVSPARFVARDNTDDSVVRVMWTIEAEELKQESYGVELLHTVGFVYARKSQYVPSSRYSPLGY